MADGCVVLQSWYFHLLVAIGLPEDQIRQRVERESSTSSSAAQNKILVSVFLCIVSSVHQLSYRQRVTLSEKKKR